MVSQRGQEPLGTLPVIREVIDVSTIERTAVSLMLLFGCLVVGASWVYVIVIRATPQDAITWILLGLFCFVVVETLGTILLWGMRIVGLPEKFVKWLAVATVGEVAALLAIVVKHFFGR